MSNTIQLAAPAAYTRKSLVKKIKALIADEAELETREHLESWLSGIIEDGTNIHFAIRRMREQGYSL